MKEPKLDSVSTIVSQSKEPHTFFKGSKNKLVVAPKSMGLHVGKKILGVEKDLNAACDALDKKKYDEG